MTAIFLKPGPYCPVSPPLGLCLVNVGRRDGTYAARPGQAVEIATEADAALLRTLGWHGAEVAA